jgi:hypothetical protein
MVKTTKAQRQALFRIFQRDFPSWHTPTCRVNHLTGRHIGVSSLPWRLFRKTVRPYFDKSGCVMVPWRGMWLGVETDGYTHS